MGAAIEIGIDDFLRVGVVIRQDSVRKPGIKRGGVEVEKEMFGRNFPIVVEGAAPGAFWVQVAMDGYFPGAAERGVVFCKQADNPESATGAQPKALIFA